MALPTNDSDLRTPLYACPCAHTPVGRYWEFSTILYEYEPNSRIFRSGVKFSNSLACVLIRETDSLSFTSIHASGLVIWLAFVTPSQEPSPFL